MDSHTTVNCIEVLKKLLDVYQSQLDAGVVEEIEVVVAALERESKCSCASATSEDWSLRALKVIAEVLRIATNISDLMS